MSDRIQKALATAGIASRRAIEDMIREGRVLVNGRPAEIGQKIDHKDHIRVDGRSIELSRKDAPPRLLLYRKRTGELVTRDDPEGRRTVFRKLPELETGRWIAVGRLDINTSGLLLMTNHGELAKRLTHPSYEMRREYAVRALGDAPDTVLAQLRLGVELDDGPAHFTTIERVVRHGQDERFHDDEEEDGEREGKANRWYIVTVKQGRNRVVRRLFESQGLQVSRLIRISYGPIALGRGIRTGSHREATPEELKAVLLAVGLGDAVPAPGKVRGAKKPPASIRPPRPGWAQKKEREAKVWTEVEPAQPDRKPRSQIERKKAAARSAAPAAKSPRSAAPRGEARFVAQTPKPRTAGRTRDDARRSEGRAETAKKSHAASAAPRNSASRPDARAASRPAAKSRPQTGRKDARSDGAANKPADRKPSTRPSPRSPRRK